MESALLKTVAKYTRESRKINELCQLPLCSEELDTIEWLHFQFSLSCIGEGNGNPLQCSCLENPRDSRAWWAAIYGVAQSREWLKWLSSSSSSVTGQWLGCICWVEMGVWMAWRANRSCFWRVSIISNSGKVEWVQILGTQYGDKTPNGQQDYK